MAEEEVTTDGTAENEDAAKKKLNLKSLLMIGGWVLAQGLIVLVVLWFAKSGNSTPAPAAAAEVAGQPEFVEVSVIPNDPDAKIKAINAKSGRLVYWMLKVHLQVPKPQLDYVTKRLEANENFVKQEISTIVSACDPVLLEQEADHATLKRQMRFALNKVLGKGTINDVLISECIPATLD